jgi:GTPase SAR1 family protein
MKATCPNSNCNYQNTNSCDEGENDVSNCAYYKSLVGDEIKSSIDSEKDHNYLPWTSKAMGLLDFPIVSQRSSPKIIGVVGPPSAGKTTFLGTLYNLLHNGYSLNDWSFSGSFTIKGWEYVSRPLTFDNSSDAHFSGHTSSDYERFQGLLHLLLKKDQFRDLFFTDASGEWFVNWADKPDSVSARGANWIHKNSDSFLFFIDCERLIGPDRGSTKEVILNIAHRLRQGIANRPVALVWAKADLLPKMRQKFKENLKADLQNIFDVFKEFEISSIPNSIPDDLVHTNIIKLVDWILNEQEKTKNATIEIQREESTPDFFFSLRR